LDWQYNAFEIDEKQFLSFVTSLDDTWAGLSLTMPLKEVAFDVVSSVDEVAKKIRSINTLLPTQAGWHGINTDVFGIVASLLEIQVTAGIESALVLGAGATSRSAIAALAELKCGKVYVSARRQEQAQELVELGESFDLDVTVVDWNPSAQLLHHPVVVSTLPGDAGKSWSDFANSSMGALLDASYHPWPTPLAAKWPNNRVASGREMLLWQASEQVRLMTGQSAPIEAMRASLPVSSD
jgi:shikimate dehydrogenase